jgi:uncharacterized membrane protein
MNATLSPDGAMPTPIPVRRRAGLDRIVGLDVARALAVFGMLGAHFGGVPPDVRAASSSWLGLVNGRPSILFAVLAGVSIALLSGRAVPVTGGDLVRARTRILVRAAWVFVIGVALEALGTDIDVILGVYAILFVLALPFLRWPPRRLLLAAAVLAVLTPPTALMLTLWAQATDSEDSPFVQLTLNGPYPALMWWTFILVGLAVGRSDLTSRWVRAQLMVVGASLAVLGYGAGWVTTRWWGQAASAQAWVDGEVAPRTWSLAWLSGAAPHSGTTFEIVGSVGVALVVIGVCLIIADLLPLLTFPLASMGSMALTAYTGSVVAAIFLGDSEGIRTWMALMSGTVVLATTWRLLLGKGPLERLLAWSSAWAGTLALRHLAPRPKLPS